MSTDAWKQDAKTYPGEHILDLLCGDAMIDQINEADALERVKDSIGDVGLSRAVEERSKVYDGDAVCVAEQDR